MSPQSFDGTGHGLFFFCPYFLFCAGPAALAIREPFWLLNVLATRTRPDSVGAAAPLSVFLPFQ